jgi:hypothetical protein
MAESRYSVKNSALCDIFYLYRCNTKDIENRKYLNGLKWLDFGILQLLNYFKIHKQFVERSRRFHECRNDKILRAQISLNRSALNFSLSLLEAVIFLPLLLWFRV